MAMITRSWISLALMVVAGAGFAQELDKKFDLKVPAVGAKEALRLLSEASGAKLEAGSRVAGEPLILDLHGVSLKEAMPKIAQVLNAEWEKTSDGYRLNRSQAMDRKLESAEFAARVEAVKQGLKRYAEEHKQDKAWDKATIEKLVQDERKRREDMMKRIQGDVGEGDTMAFSVDSGNTDTPAGNALVMALSGIAPKDLAAIQPGGRVVFSSNPTLKQLPTSFDARRAMDTFVRNHNLLAQIVAAEPAPKQNMFFEGGVDLQAKPLQGVAKLILIVSRPTADSSLEIEMKIADASGKVVGKSGTSLDVDLEEDKVSIDGEATKIELSPESVELLRLMHHESTISDSVNVMEINGDRVVFSSGTPEAGKPLTPSLLGLLTSPDKRDPLSLFVSEGLMQTASARKENLVASPPDAAFGAFSQGLGNSPTTSTILSMLGTAGFKTESKDGWLLLSPAAPSLARQSRFDRVALGALLRGLVQKGYTRLGEVATYAASLPAYREARSIDDTYFQIVGPQAYKDYRETMSMAGNMLRLYGMLNDEQRRQLNGPGVVIRSLSPAGMDLAAGMVYGGAAGPRFGGARRGGGRSMSMMVTSTRGGEGDGPPMFAGDHLSKEPTEAYPTGLPMNAILTANTEADDAVFSRLSGSRDGRFFSAGELGMYNGMSENQLASDPNLHPPTYTKFTTAKLARLSFVLNLSEKDRTSTMLRDAWVEANALEVSMDQLPAAFLKRVKEAQERMRNLRIGQGTPPPGP